MRGNAYDAIKRGIDWEKTCPSIGRRGCEGNTRTGAGQERLLGKSKEVNYAEVALAFFYGSVLFAEPGLLPIASQTLGYATDRNRR